MQISIIRTNGKEETHEGDFQSIHKLIDAEWFDTVNLRDGRVMVVDDLGYETRMEDRGEDINGAHVFESVAVKARKPVNQKATALYWSVCIPGTTHQIVGDVAVVRDSDL